MEPISRRDIIAMGGNFTIDKFDASSLPRWAKTDTNRYQAAPLRALDGKTVHVHVEDGYSMIVLWPDHWSGLDHVHIQVGMFMDDTDHNRNRVGQFIAPMDPGAAEALDIKDWDWGYQALNRDSRRHGIPCYDQDVLAELGLEKDAGLYVAVQQEDRRAEKHYIAIGADPLRPTFEGDCVARLSIAQGNFTYTQSPELINARHLGTGESGAFGLARAGMTSQVASLVQLGLDCTIQDRDGKTVLDRFRRPERRAEVERAIAERLQQQLETNTAPLRDRLPDLYDNNTLAKALAATQPVRSRGMRL